MAVLLAVLAVALGIISGLRTAEPRYQGRSLSSWLQQGWQTPLMETQRLAQAQAAVYAIGAQKALPTLISLVKTKDSRSRAWSVEQIQKYHLRYLHLYSANERHLQGITGFELLGTNCTAAVPELSKLLEDQELAFVATRCLDSIGKPAEAALCQALTNRDAQVRCWSLRALASITDDVEVYINRVKPCLSDPESVVRFSAVEAIAVQTEAPDLAVPLLIAALRDSDDGTSSHAAEGLAGFGTNAASAWGPLTNVVAEGRERVTRAVLKALPSISPENALVFLTNAAATGPPPIMGAALFALKPMAPQLVVQMMLTELRSADTDRRLVALNFARFYDMHTPGLVEALKLSAGAADPEVSRRAISTMRSILEKQKEKQDSFLQISGEPSYQGKPLGQWLRMRDGENSLLTNAVEALRHMGPGATSALLARLTYKDPVFDLDDYQVGIDAATAFISLNDEAAPALPALAKLMDSDREEIAMRAMIATLGTGTSAMPCLIKGLTNRFAAVRGQASGFIREFGTQFPEQRKQAVLCLTKLLDDPDEDVRLAVTNNLRELDPRSSHLAPKLTPR